MADGAHTIPHGFQMAARRSGKALDVLNLGIGGVGIESYLALIRDAIPLLAPDDVVLVLYANDFSSRSANLRLSGAPLVGERRRFWTSRTIEVLASAVRGEVVPRAWHASAYPFFSAVPDPRNPWSTHTRDYESFVEKGVAEAMKAGRFNPTLVDQPNRFASFLVSPVDLHKPLLDLRDYAARHGVGLWLVYLPTRYQVSDDYLRYAGSYSRKPVVASLIDERYQIHARMLARTARRLSLAFIDFTTTQRRREASGTRGYWNYDDHMRGGTYLFVGEALYEWWERERATDV